MSNDTLSEENAEVCDACAKQLDDHVFDICRQFEQVIFFDGDKSPEVEVIESCAIATYCSAECLDCCRDELLAKENVRSTYPDIGPVESCSRCGRPVDMTRFHLTWVEDEAIIEQGDFIGEITPVDSTVLAVLCQQCAPPSRATQTDDLIGEPLDAAR